MQPGKLDLPTIWRGCNYLPVVLTWKDLGGVPFDLTGWTPFAQSRNIVFDVAVTDAANGVTQLSLAFAKVVNLRLGEGRWDWIWSSPDGILFPPTLSGIVAIKQPTTVIPISG